MPIRDLRRAANYQKYNGLPAKNAAIEYTEERRMARELTSTRVTWLASRLAASTGEDMEAAVVGDIEERLARVAPQPTAARDDEIDALFDRLARMPVRDARPPDDIVGYGLDGLPQ